MATQVLDKALEQRLETMESGKRVAVKITPCPERLSDVIDWLGHRGVSLRSGQADYEHPPHVLQGVQLSADQIRALARSPYVDTIEPYNVA